MANAMSPRALRAVERLLDLVSERLQPIVPALLARADDMLRADQAAAGDAGVVETLAQGRRVLAREGERVFPAFVASLRGQALAAWAHEPPVLAPDGPPGSLAALSLVDDEIVDEEAAMAGIAARLESVASLPLLLLGQRFAVLLERPPLPAAMLPVGPQAMIRALRDAGRDVGLGLHARLALYRAADLGFIERYPALAERMDASLDASGILPGLRYVPLRTAGASHHPGRGAARAERPDPGAVPLSDVAALRIVNAMLDELAPPGSLPERGLAERREAVSALVRFLVRHGADSPEWRRCLEVARSVAQAAREGRAVDEGAMEWMRRELQDLGHPAAGIGRLVAGLATLGLEHGSGDGHAMASAGIALAATGARERRWRERLEGLPQGTVLGFTASNGIARASLRGREGDSLLLVREDSGREARVDAAAVARLMAGGHAWVVRQRGAQA